MGSDLIRAEIDRKIKQIIGESVEPICDVVIYDDERVEVVCDGTDFIIIGDPDSGTTRCMINFMKTHKLSFAVVDIDSRQGREMDELIGLSKTDLPIIFSTVAGDAVHSRTCPEGIKEVLQYAERGL